MNDLATLLDRAVPAVDPADPTADLERGRRALARSRRGRGAAGLAGVAAAGVLAVGASHRLAPGDTPVAEAPGTTTTEDLTDGTVQAGPFTFASTPTGWHVQGHRPGSVTFALDDGSSDPHPDAFVGKIVLLYDREGLRGDRLLLGDREFRVSRSDEWTTVAVRTRSGEPRGTIRLQVPAGTGWSVDTAVEMLDGVTVGAGAEAPEHDPDVEYHEGPDGYIIIGDH